MTARILNCSATEYFADPCATPSLSASIAHTIISRSPLHGYLEHPKLGGKKREATKEMNRGSIIHALLLGKGTAFEVRDYPNYRTKVAQVWQDQVEAQGLVPVLQKEMDAYQEAASEIRKRIEHYGITLHGNSEVAVEWTDEDVLCRGMMDHILPKQRIIIDLKTCQSAHPLRIASALYQHGGYMQYAAYSRAIEALYPDSGDWRFLYLYAEAEPPYAVTPVELDGAFQLLAMQHWQKARETWRLCLESNVWPDYTDAIVTVKPPAWAARELETVLYDAEDEYNEEDWNVSSEQPF